MKVNIVDLSKIKGKEFILIPFGDFHLGAKECALDAIKKQINWIKDNKNNCRCVLMGDILNAGIRDSPGSGPYDENMDPQEQYELALELLRPIKSQIIGIHRGNHEDRIFNQTGIDMIKNLCRELDVPYLCASCYHYIKFGPYNYTMYTTHGSGGAKFPYTKSKVAFDLGQAFDFDIVCVGHVHHIDVNTTAHRRLNTRGKTVEEYKKYFILTGSYLRYELSYAEAKNLFPSKVGCPKLKFFKDRKDIHASI